MENNNPPNKVGRKPKDISLEILIKLASMRCTRNEMAAFFDCAPITIDDHILRDTGMKFPTFFEKYSALGHISIRRALYQRALKGSDKLLALLCEKTIFVDGVKAEDSDMSSDPALDSAKQQVDALLKFQLGKGNGNVD